MFPRKKTPRIPRISRIFVCLIFFVIICVIRGSFPAFAERNNNPSLSIDLMGGISNKVGQGSYAQNVGVASFYSVYPSFGLNSVTDHSTIDLQYNFAAEHYQMDPSITVLSHVFTGRIDAQFGRSRLRISDSLNTAPEYFTVYALKGIVPTPGGFEFLYQPELSKQSTIRNSADIGLDYTLTEKSYITFSGSQASFNYGAAASNHYLSDRMRTEGSFSYSYRQTENSTLRMKYTVRQNDYQYFATVRSHIASIGLTYRLSPNWNFNLDAGPSFIEKADIGYEVSATVARELPYNRFTAGYSHRAAESTGYGATTEYHQGNLAFSQMLGARTVINFNASAYRERLYDSWGTSGSIAISREMGPYCMMSVGSSYNVYDAYSNKRVYISFRFNTAKKRTD